jgi:hypothetical protein
LFSFIRKIDPHMEGEEKSFYQELQKHKEAKENSLEAVEEHQVAKMAMKELLDTPATMSVSRPAAPYSRP